MFGSSAKGISTRRQGVLLAFFGMLAVSTDSFFIRLADIDGFDVTFWVGIFTAASLFTLVVLRDRRSPLANIRHGGPGLWTAAALQAGSTSVFVLAVTNTSVANVVVIIAAAPLTAAGFAWLLLREQTTRRVWIAIAVSMVGILVVVSGSFGGGTLVGDLLAVAAIIQFGLSLVVLRKHPDVDRMLMVAIAGVGMAAIAVIPGTLWGHDAQTWIALTLMGLIFGPLARVLIAEAPKHLPAAEVGLFAPVETVAATIWAWLFFSEPPTMTTVVGGVIIVLAVLWGTAPAPAPEPEWATR